MANSDGKRQSLLSSSHSAAARHHQQCHQETDGAKSPLNDRLGRGVAYTTHIVKPNKRASCWLHTATLGMVIGPMPWRLHVWCETHWLDVMTVATTGIRGWSWRRHLSGSMQWSGKSTGTAQTLVTFDDWCSWKDPACFIRPCRPAPGLADGVQHQFHSVASRGSTEHPSGPRKGPQLGLGRAPW